mgnify:CR=1 FL=1
MQTALTTKVSTREQPVLSNDAQAKGATLVLLPGNTQTPEILFLPRRNPAAETWTGHMYSAQEANEISWSEGNLGGDRV